MKLDAASRSPNQGQNGAIPPFVLVFGAQNVKELVQYHDLLIRLKGQI